MIEVHPVGSQFCIYNQQTGLLALGNETVATIADWASSGRTEAEIVQAFVPEAVDPKGETSAAIKATLATLLDPGDELDAIEDEARTAQDLFSQRLALPNGCSVDIKADDPEIFGVVSDLAEPYRASAPGLKSPVHEVLCLDEADGHSVFVDGVLIPEDPILGWTYKEEERGIAFEGSFIPPPGAEVRIEYDVDV